VPLRLLEVVPQRLLQLRISCVLLELRQIVSNVFSIFIAAPNLCR
jgi:hypothetical protein